jgi:hypothetical protein
MVDLGGMHPPREGQFKNPLVLGKFRSDVHFWHLLNNPVAPALVCFWAIADKGGF